MKLTKIQRYTAYIIMLEEAKIFTDYGGFCRLWSVKIMERVPEFDIYESEDFKSLLPELYALRPAFFFNNGCYWFSCDSEGWESRMELLKKCIEETYC